MKVMLLSDIPYHKAAESMCKRHPAAAFTDNFFHLALNKDSWDIKEPYLNKSRFKFSY